MKCSTKRRQLGYKILTKSDLEEMVIDLLQRVQDLEAAELRRKVVAQVKSYQSTKPVTHPQL